MNHRSAVAAIVLMIACSNGTLHPKPVVAKPRARSDGGARTAQDANAFPFDASAGEDAAALARAQTAAREADATATPLCNGDDRMQLAAADFSNASYGPSDGLAMRNGIRGLFIDGRCRFYAIRPAQHGTESVELAEVHSGVLNDATRDAVSNDLRYSEWASLQVRASQAPTSPDASFTFDAGSATLTDGARLLDCYAGCNAIQGTPIANEVLAVLDAADRWIDDLYASGDPMTGGVRFIVMARPTALGPLQGGRPATWPLSKPLQNFVSPSGLSGAQPYHSFTLTGIDAQTLRDLRHQQAADGKFTPWWLGDTALPVSDTSDGPIYSLTVSDLLPYEDETGPGMLEALHIWNQVFPPHP